jgi:hypothetical protein
MHQREDNELNSLSADVRDIPSIHNVAAADSNVVDAGNVLNICRPRV